MTVHAAIPISGTDNEISAVMLLVVLFMWVFIFNFVSVFGRFSPYMVR